MKCEKCGKENEASSLFCEHCGHPLRSLENWETQEPPVAREAEDTENLVHEEGKPTLREGHHKNSGARVAIIIGVCILGLALIGGGIFGFFSFQKSNAINVSLKNGNTFLTEEKFQEALTEFEKVLALDENNGEALLGKAKAATGLGDYQTARTFYEEALKHEKNPEKIKAIYDVYIQSEIDSDTSQEDLIALLDEAAKATGDQKYEEQKSDLNVKAPSFNLNPGTYQGNQSLEIIKGDAGDKVYYTTDGTTPTAGSTEYTAAISLTKGEHLIKAIEMGSSGFSSKIVEGKYSIVDVPTSGTTGGTVSGSGSSGSSYDYYNFNLYASSTLPDMAGINYSVWNLMDGNNNTAWVEGVSGDGVGEYVQCVYQGSGPLTLHGFTFKTGYVKSSTSFAENGSVRGMVIYVNTSPIANVTLERIRDEQVFAISPTTIYPGDSVVFVIDSAVPGPSDGEHDTALSEITLY